MAVCYRIKNWRDNFEVSQSLRIRGPLAWVGLPTKHDGKSFRRIIQQPNGPALYGCWCLIVQIAAKSQIRGVLADSDGPLSADDMEFKTGCPATLFVETIQLLLSKQISWLEEVDFSTISEHDPPLSERAPYTRQTRQGGPDRTEPDKTGQITGAGFGGGSDFQHEKPNTVTLKPLDKIKPIHLPSDQIIEGLHEAIQQSDPGFLPAGDDGLLLLLGAAERAIDIGKKPVALFVSIVRDKRWDLVDERQRASARQRLDLYRKRQAESG